MNYVRQKYNLATTGKLGQKLLKPVGGSSVIADRGPSGASDARKGSYKVPTHHRGK
jgi:hypothetical protein